MSLLNELLAANKAFLEANQNLPKLYKGPTRYFALVTCMDARLVEFAEQCLGIKRGDANVIKAAGNGVWSSDLSDIIVSLLVSIYELGSKEIILMGHECCGMTHATTDALAEEMLKRGIKQEDIDRLKPSLSKWIDDFKDPVDNVKKSVATLRQNPLIPKDIPIHGLLIHPDTGIVTTIVNGYEN